MFEWLLEVGVSIVLATALMYFVFLTPPPPSNAGRPRTQRRGAGAAPSANGNTWDVAMDTTHWVDVCLYWLASMRLGGWTYDGRTWSERIASAADSGLLNVCRSLRAARNLTANVPLVRIDSLILGSGGIGSKANSSRNDGDEEGHSSGAGAALPVLTGVSSRASIGAVAGSGNSREVVFHLSFIDGHFHLQSYCELPLLFGLPPTLQIPSDVLTLKCRVDVRDVLFQASLCVRMVSGRRIEFFFTSMPLFEAHIRIVAPLSSHSRRNGHQHTMEAKGGDILGNAMRVALQSLVYPDVLVLTIQREAPRLQWGREKLDAVAL